MRIPYPPRPTRTPDPRPPTTSPLPHPPPPGRGPHPARARLARIGNAESWASAPRRIPRPDCARSRKTAAGALSLSRARLCGPVASPRTASAPRPHGRRLTGAHPCDARAGLRGSEYGWKSGAPPGWSRDDRPFTGSGLTTRVRVHRSRIGVTTRKHGPSEKQGTCDRINTIMPTRRLSRLELTEPSRVELS